MEKNLPLKDKATKINAHNCKGGPHIQSIKLFAIGIADFSWVNIPHAPHITTNIKGECPKQIAHES
jgi:hypothetical protein